MTDEEMEIEISRLNFELEKCNDYLKYWQDKANFWERQNDILLKRMIDTKELKMQMYNNNDQK